MFNPLGYAQIIFLSAAAHLPGIASNANRQYKLILPSRTVAAPIDSATPHAYDNRDSAKRIET